MKFILPTILIIIAGAVFFWLTDPILNNPLVIDPVTGGISGGVFPLLSERRDLNTALANSRRLQEDSRDLVAKFNNLSDLEKSRVNKLLPNHIDNVQLVIDINSIADKYGMTIKNVKIRTEEDTALRTNRRPTAGNSEKIAYLSFSVTGTYSQLRNLLTDLARSLRLVDVTQLSFVAGDQDLYQFNLELKTYWLE